MKHINERGEVLFFDAQAGGPTVNVVTCGGTQTYVVEGQTIKVGGLQFFYDDGTRVHDTSWTMEEFMRFRLAANKERQARRRIAEGMPVKGKREHSGRRMIR